ncbi:Alpha/Beta hydrolase protein [Radiomyces spectabilis]|uniref:Alpha/Beta hydrolase protein n=1 Tax=Radiomyces spectabilis TaxID=64574 RepID=UPI00221E78FF|nr:Alpha/Beta hydrolase protein [Radiomyces spectabilis]KAI8381398.1 Alpha/Beta hydrolase protein [Radiomyces spectabilis]
MLLLSTARSLSVTCRSATPRRPTRLFPFTTTTAHSSFKAHRYSSFTTTVRPMHCLDDSSVESFMVPGAKVFDRYFECPLDYNQPSSDKIQVFARHLVPVDKVDQMHTLPFFLYLQGGPGFEVGLPRSATSGWLKVAFDKGYQVLLLDQRGTGLSSQISAESLEQFDSDEAKAQYLTHFRADNIVRDCETIRQKLTEDRANKAEERLTLLGQSFGGFCIVTYLSLFPQSIKQAFITGGVPPMVDSPDPVYRALYPRILKKNKLYYTKFPQDVARVRKIYEHLWDQKVQLPNGGTLSPRRFLQLGILFGGAEGYDTLHEIVVLAANDLDRMQRLTYRTLDRIQSLQSWDSNVLYAIIHEAIYCQSNTSRWSAERILSEEPFKAAFEWRISELNPSQPIHFTGETIYPFMFDDYAELRPLKNVANLLAETNWGSLYDRDVLSRNEVPVAGVSYFDDMYVDRQFSEDTAADIRGFKQWITNEYAHNGLRMDGEKILDYLMQLARGDVAYNR